MSLLNSAAPRRRRRVDCFNSLLPLRAGNIARTCAATAVALHLVEPLGFELNDAKLKRAGLDYWKSVFVQKHASWQV